jgi:SAM-dependent methyltransferase
VPTSSSSLPCPVCRTDSHADGIELNGYRLYLCPSCSLRFAPEAFEAAVDYDRVYQSPEYETEQVQTLRGIDGRAIAQHPTYRAFFQEVRHRPGVTLLDLGCGVGRFGHAAHALGWRVSGIDVSALAIAAGQTVAPFPLRAGRVEELLQEQQRFDVLTAFEVLEHLSSPVDFLVSARGLLRPGGQIFCTVPNWNCASVQSSTRPDWLPPIHLLFFSQPALHALGEHSGLARVETGMIRGDPPPRGVRAQLRWLTRRLALRPREPLGLWLHGWVEA